MPQLIAPVVAHDLMATSAQPTLATDVGLVLRPWHDGDVPALRTAFADPAIQRWNHRSMDTDDEARAWITMWERAWSAATDASWAVTSADGDVVARMALHHIDLQAGSAEVSYWTMPAHRGRGAAPAGVRAVARWGFDVLGLHRLWLAHAVANHASCRVATKAGFTFEGTRRSEQLLADGWHDTHLHARIATDPSASAH